jgi:hypothetical protein
MDEEKVIPRFGSWAEAAAANGRRKIGFPAPLHCPLCAQEIGVAIPAAGVCPHQAPAAAAEAPPVSEAAAAAPGVNVDGIARHLPGLWKAGPNDVERGTGGEWVGLEGPGAGLRVWCWGPDRGRLVLHVRPADPALGRHISGYTVRELKVGAAQISVSAKRSAVEIASEIVRRLLPGGRELLELARKAAAAQSASDSCRDALVAELKAAHPGLGHVREEGGDVCLSDQGTVYLRVSGWRDGLGAVDFQHFRPDGPLAVAVVRAVAEYLARPPLGDPQTCGDGDPD